MSRLSSSISNSDLDRMSAFRTAIRTTAWIVLGLAAFDVVINLAFAYPSDPKAIPSKLQVYFEYGRSTDAQLARMTDADRSQTAPITLAGWYDPLPIEERPGRPQTPIITLYGMSHAVQLAHALSRVSDAYKVRVAGAPGATANWAYGAYLRDRGGGKGRAVVLALMSANLAMITTMSPMTWNIGFPMPYTADRFYVRDGSLRVVHPPYDSFDNYVKMFKDRSRWSLASDLFATNDTMYDAFMKQETFLDHSSLFRLIRRAYGQRHERRARAAVIDQNGFHPDTEQIEVARAIVREFASQARSDGMLPVIYLVNNFGYSDYLFQALSPELNADKIPFVSSHQIISPSDPRGYLSDSHFTPAVDDQIARALISVVEGTR